jgi:hypothetical protein
MEVWDSKVDDRMVVALGTGLFTNDIWHNGEDWRTHVHFLVISTLELLQGS